MNAKAKFFFDVCRLFFDLFCLFFDLFRTRFAWCKWVLTRCFQYSNVYVVTPKINQLYEDEHVQNECLEYVAKTGKTPLFSDVFAIY